MLKIIASNKEGLEGLPIGIGPGWNIFTGLKFHIYKQPKYKLEDCKITEINEEEAKSLVKSAGWGLVGAAVAGPIGLLVGLAMGGKKVEKIYSIITPDEVKIVASTKNSGDIKELEKFSQKTKYSDFT
jgi:hypothetical protein